MEVQIDSALPKEQRIIIAAEHIFSLYGFEGATLDEIIELADVGKGTVYKYFGNKEQLFYYLASRKNEAFVRKLKDSVNSAGTLKDKLFAFFCDMIDFYRENSSLWQIIYFEMFKSNACITRDADGEFDAVHRFAAELSEKDREQMVRYYKLLASEFTILQDIIRNGISEGVLKPVDVESSTMYHFFGVAMCVFHAEGEVSTASAAEGAAVLVDRFLHGGYVR